MRIRAFLFIIACANIMNCRNYQASHYIGLNGELESLTLLLQNENSEYYAISYWSDGLRINGFLGRPKKEGRHPAIVYNRGGFRETGALQGWEIVPAVEAGYVTVATQYRGNGGSQGRDEFGSSDANDVINILSLVRKLPYVDPERIGMVGHSRGGMMTYLALKHDSMTGSKTIKAAAVLGGVADLFDLYNDSPMFISMIGVRPHEDSALYKSRSATYWPQLINSPLLIVHGEDDPYVSVTQAHKINQLLLKANKEVKLIIYPNEGHELLHHYGGWAEALRWLQRFLAKPGEDLLFESHRDIMPSTMEWFKTH